MGLAPDDRKPTPITIREAYTRIRQWYQTWTALFAQRPPEEATVAGIKIVRDLGTHAKACLDLVESLPEEQVLSDLEIRAVLAEVIAGKLEWAYHQSDGAYEMGAYAHAALGLAGLPALLSEEERRHLRKSRLYPYLHCDRGAS
ncbi:MAG: hypothetical protein K6V36_05510 [Anaerolineae bacterium]|nr:hypothetical protein [Anaerolineae bacterium]